MKRIIIFIAMLICLTNTCFANILYSDDGRVSVDAPTGWYYEPQDINTPGFNRYLFKTADQNSYVMLVQSHSEVLYPYTSAFTMSYEQKRNLLQRSIKSSLDNLKSMGVPAKLKRADVLPEGYARSIDIQYPDALFHEVEMTTYRNYTEYALTLCFSEAYPQGAGGVFSSLRVNGVPFSELPRR